MNKWIRAPCIRQGVSKGLNKWERREPNAYRP